MKLSLIDQAARKHLFDKAVFGVLGWIRGSEEDEWELRRLFAKMLEEKKS